MPNISATSLNIKKSTWFKGSPNPSLCAFILIAHSVLFSFFAIDLIDLLPQLASI